MLKEEFTEWANNGGIRSQDPCYGCEYVNKFNSVRSSKVRSRQAVKLPVV